MNPDEVVEDSEGSEDPEDSEMCLPTVDSLVVSVSAIIVVVLSVLSDESLSLVMTNEMINKVAEKTRQMKKLNQIFLI